MSSGVETNLTVLIAQLGFPIAITVYLLWERTQTFKQGREDDKAEKLRLEGMTTTMLEIVKANTASNTDLRATIQKLCEIVNGKENKNG